MSGARRRREIGRSERKGRARTLLVVGLAGSALVTTAGCGAAAKSVIPAPVAIKPTTARHPYSSATAQRNRLLALAKPGTRIGGQGNVPGWPPANGSAIPATATDVSGFAFNSDMGQHEQYLSFAVSDAHHDCAGGDIVTNAKGTKVVSDSPIKLPSHVPCTGDEVAELAGHG